MKNRLRISGIASVGTVLLLVFGCAGQTGPSADYSVAAALMAGADSNASSSSSVAGSSGVAAQVATQAISQGTSFAHVDRHLRRHANDIMMARLREGLHKQRGRSAGAIPVAFACADGTCNLNGSETLTGSQSCSNGGTVTARNVPITQTGTSSDSGGAFNVNTVTNLNGDFQYSGCKTLGLDFDDLTTITYENVTIDGTITINGSNTNVSNGSFSCTGTTTVSCTSSSSGSYTANATVTSQGLSVNGGTAAVVDVTDTSTYTTADSLAYTFDSSSGSITSFSGTVTVSGTLNITGTVDGTSVSLNTTIDNIQLTCDADGCK